MLPSIINDAQTYYTEGRFIGENIRPILDILHFTAPENLEGIALFIDFEKVLDSPEWDFLFKTLDTFQLGHEFKSWVSNWFDLHRGVRQGCPLSGLLFVLAVEILFIAIRASRDKKGIQIANREMKVTRTILQFLARIYTRLKN